MKQWVTHRIAERTSLRAVAIPAYRMYARALFQCDSPRILANGIPKGGTHLLTTLLDAIPNTKFSGYTETLTTFRITPFSSAAFTASDVDWALLAASLSRIPRGQYMTVHFPCAPGLQDLVHQLRFRHVVILRDPRDVVVSDAAYISRYRRHAHHRRFAPLTASEAIRLVIEGFRTEDGTVALGSIGDRTANYAAWIADPQVLVCRFEDLVGDHGGGAFERQREVVMKVAAHVGRPLTAGGAERISQRIWSPASHTFRSGRIGAWQSAFTAEHRRLFKRVAGEWLLTLGYESTTDW